MATDSSITDDAIADINKDVKIHRSVNNGRSPHFTIRDRLGWTEIRAKKIRDMHDALKSELGI